MPKVIIDISEEELESFKNMEIRSYHPKIFSAVKNGWVLIEGGRRHKGGNKDANSK